MFISHFNRYFEKHAKLTYFVLLIIIIATFVIFVTPGSMNGGRGGLKDFGKMYGKTLKLELVQKELAKTTLSIWIQQPQLFGMDFSSQKEALFNEMLNRMRILHYAKAKGMDKVTDDQLRERIQKITLVQDEKGVFSKVAFDNLLETVKRNLGMVPADFDQVVKETMIAENVIEEVKGRVSVTDAEIDDVLAQYVLKCATVAVSGDDARPTEEEIQSYFASRKADISLPESKNALAAVFRFDAVRAAMGASATPTDAEISQRYEANKATVYKDQTLEQVKEAIQATLSNEKVRSEARKKANALRQEFQTVVEGEAQDVRASRFEEKAKNSGAAVNETGVVALDNVISGMGTQERMAEAIRNAPKVGDVTPLIAGDGYVAVAMVVSSQPTQMPESLPEASGNGAARDPLRRIVENAITREKALAFFAVRVKLPYDKYLAAVEELKANNGMSAAEKQQALYALVSEMDVQLLNRFFILEKRSFSQVSFDYEAFEGQVSEPTTEEISAAFENRKAEFEGKTLADVQETIVSDLKAVAAHNLAEAAAADFAEKFAAARIANAAENANGLMEKMAGEVTPKGRFVHIEKADPAYATPANSEVLRAVYQATLTSPVSSAIHGQDASSVILLTAIEAGHLADPSADDEYYAALLQAYHNDLELVAAQLRAQAEKKRIEDALAANGGDFDAAAGELKFEELAAFSVNDIRENAETVQEIQKAQHIDLYPLYGEKELIAIKNPGVFLTPVKSVQEFNLGPNQSFVLPIGYKLLYVAGRTIPEKQEANAAERQKLQERLLAERQSDELYAFYQTLMEQSDTQLRTGTPYTGDAE